MSSNIQFESIGKITAVSGTVWAVSEGSQRALTLESPVYEGDSIGTGSHGKVLVEFIDNTKVYLGKNSTIRLEHLEYNPDNEDNSGFTLELVAGNFRTITGDIVKDSPDNFILKSPMGVVNIKGTTVVSQINPDSEIHTPIEMTPGKVLEIRDTLGNEYVISVPGKLSLILRGQPLNSSQELSEEMLGALQENAGLLLDELNRSLSGTDVDSTGADEEETYTDRRADQDDDRSEDTNVSDEDTPQDKPMWELPSLQVDNVDAGRLKAFFQELIEVFEKINADPNNHIVTSRFLEESPKDFGNDDLTAKAIFDIDASIAESDEGDGGELSSIVFTISRDTGIGGECCVDWAVTGTGSDPALSSDFDGGVLPSGTVNFAAGQSSAQIVLYIKADYLVESDEHFKVELSNPGAGGVIGNGSVDGCIVNDDTEFSIAPADADKAEGGSGGTTEFTFTVTRTGDLSNTSSVDWVLSGSGSDPALFSDFDGGVLPSGTVNFAAGQNFAEISISVNADTDIEGDETFEVTLSNPGNDDTISTDTASGIIHCDDAVFDIAADDAVKAEGDSGTTAFTFTVTRTGGLYSPSSVKWTVSGTGADPVQASDFDGNVLPSGTVNFAAGQSSAKISIFVNADTDAESDQSFEVTLSDPGDNDIISSDTAIGIITNDDTEFSIAPADADKAEGDSGGTTEFTFTVTRTGDLSNTSSVDWVLSGSGSDPALSSDFNGGVLPFGTVNFAAEQSSAQISISVNADTDIEGDETFEVTLSNPGNDDTISTDTASGIIHCDDAVFDIAADDAVKAEGDSGTTEFTFTVTRTGGLYNPSSVKWTVTETGTDPVAASDFDGNVLPSGTLDFNAGETSKTISISVVAGSDFEPDEAFTITLSDAGDNDTITTDEASGTIENDDNSLSLSDLDGSNGFTINGIDENDLSGYSVSSAGDVNGDGFEDLIIGAPTQSGAGGESGEAYVVYGGEHGVNGWTSAGYSFDLSGLDGTNGFTLTGIDAGDYCGYSVSSAGDVNGDGFDDIIIGAYYAAPGGDIRAGESYLVFGSSSPGAAVVDLSDLGTDGFILSGADERDWSGYSVSSAGDVNGDGLDDFIIGAPLSDGPTSTYPDGEAYLVFGSTSLAVDMDLSTLGASDGFTLLAGAESWDNAGYSVSSAGDFNGDGFDDLLIGAKEALVEGEDGAGRVYLIYGGSDISGDIDLATNADITINGIDEKDWAGYSVSSAGDINGDGFDDIIIGAPGTDDPGTTNGVGESYVIFGKANPAATLNFDGLDATDGFCLKGIDEDDSSGQAVSAAGDINADGYDDMIIGAKNAGAGESYVVFGGEFGVNSWESPTSDLDLDSLDGTMGFTLTGIDYLDNSGCSVSAAGDINGDGFDDLIIGAHNVDQAGADIAGESYVIYGDNFTGSATAGTDGDDIMTGTADADNLVGGLGNDTLNGNGGADVLYGGAGDDLFSISDLSFFKVKGGAGNDTLSLADGLNLDLTAMAGNKISGIETIDMTGNSAVLSLNLQDVVNLSDSTNNLFIDGAVSSGDTNSVNFENGASGTWSYTGDSGDYEKWTNSDGEATVYVEDGVDVFVIV